MRGRSLFFSCLVFFACAGTSFTQTEDEQPAAQSGFGAALLLGEPMGVSAKLWLSDVAAIDAGAGWSLYRRTDSMGMRGAPYAYIEYLRHFFDIIKAGEGKFVYFIGIGAEGAWNYFDDGTDALYCGVRLPFGISYMFQNAPFDIFLELDPSVVFYYYGVTSDMGACVGIRYWFR